MILTVGMRLYTTDLKEEGAGRKLSVLCCQRSGVFSLRADADCHEWDSEGGHAERGAHRSSGNLRRRLERESGGSTIERNRKRNWRRTAFKGSLWAGETEGLEDFIGDAHTLTYDDQIGSIGAAIISWRCSAWLRSMTGRLPMRGNKERAILLMIHTGSLMIGHQSGRISQMITRGLYPKLIPHPDNGIYLLPEGEWRGRNGVVSAALPATPLILDLPTGCSWD